MSFIRQVFAVRCKQRRSLPISAFLFLLLCVCAEICRLICLIHHCAYRKCHRWFSVSHWRAHCSILHSSWILHLSSPPAIIVNFSRLPPIDHRHQSLAVHLFIIFWQKSTTFCSSYRRRCCCCCCRRRHSIYCSSCCRCCFACVFVFQAHNKSNKNREARLLHYFSLFHEHSAFLYLLAPNVMMLKEHLATVKYNFWSCLCVCVCVKIWIWNHRNAMAI